ncbi:DUF3291 domain-containing protein [Amycolatopsis sp. RTGN1]|uniref:DUF3291 domain-containing protein n=1 Tax=Amycolatopsis ponsaeliensis TaxID=2992142 RepID=UPI0033070DED
MPVGGRGLDRSGRASSGGWAPTVTPSSPPPPSTARWWVADGRRPTVDQALARLGFLRDHGPSPQAFSLLRRFTVDGRRAR